MDATSTRRVVVEPGGTGVVAHVGLHALGAFADRLGLGDVLSSAIPWRGGGLPVHDRGKVLVQIALMLAGGGESCRNILAKVPVEHQGEVKAAYWAIFDPTGEPPGDKSIAVAAKRAADFSASFGRRFPSAVACLNDDLASLFSYLRFPAEHHKRIRHSNFIERTFGETRRRVKVIGRLPGERSCLGLVLAVLDRASRGWRGVTMTPATVRQLQELRR